LSILLAFSVWRQTYMLMHGAYESQQRLILVSLQNAVMSKVRQEDVVKLTQQLIKISSVNPPGQYQEIVGFLEGKLKELGMRSEIVASDPNRPNVLGWLRKDEGKKFLLIGHTDTVPVTEKEMNNWIVDPFSGNIVGGKLYGRGSSDMKGGIASVLVAIKALQDTGVNLETDLMVAWCVDEETTGPGGSRYVSEKGYFKPVFGAIDPEPSDMYIRGWFKGRSQYEITVTGRSVHTSTPEKGINAITKMAKVVLALQNLKLKYRHHEFLGDYTTSIVEVSGGARVPTVPGVAKLVLEVRMVPSQDFESVKAEIEDVLAKLKAEDPELNAKVDVLIGRNPLETSRSERVFTVVSQAHREVTGKEVGFFTADMNGGGSGDLYPLLTQGIPSVYFGPGTHRLAHATNECVEIKFLVDCAKVYTLAIPRMCGVVNSSARARGPAT